MEEIHGAKINEEGRLVIPASYRKQHGLAPGQEVVLRATREGLLITTFDQAVERFQDDVAALVGTDSSVVDELISDRRKEAAKERE